jgi:hypothetical protein
MTNCASGKATLGFYVGVDIRARDVRRSNAPQRRLPMLDADKLKRWHEIVSGAIDPDGWDCNSPLLREVRDEMALALAAPAPGDGLREALEACRDALDSIWAAVGDALLSGKGITQEYANSVGRESRNASNAATAALSRTPRAEQANLAWFVNDVKILEEFTEHTSECGPSHKPCDCGLQTVRDRVFKFIEDWHKAGGQVPAVSTPREPWRAEEGK